MFTQRKRIEFKQEFWNSRKSERYIWLRLSFGPRLASEATFSARILFTAITRQGVLFLWPIRLPGQGGKVDSWNRSALEAAMLSINRWVQDCRQYEFGGL